MSMHLSLNLATSIWIECDHKKVDEESRNLTRFLLPFKSSVRWRFLRTTANLSASIMMTEGDTTDLHT